MYQLNPRQKIQVWISSPKHLIPFFIFVSFIGFGTAYFTSNVYAISFSVAILLASLGHFLSIDYRYKLPSPVIDSRIFVAVGLFILSIAIFEYSMNEYSRSMFTHLLLSFSYTCLFIGSVFSQQRFLILATTIIIAIIHRGMIYYTSAVYLGKDTLFHNQLAAEISTFGSLSPIVGTEHPRYYYAPLYHTYAAISELTLGISLKNAVFLSISIFITIVTILVVYRLVTEFWDQRSGVAAAVFCAGADFLVRWAIQPQPTSIGIALFTIILYLYIKYMRFPNNRSLVLLVICMSILSITHHVSMIITVFALFLYSSFLVIYHHPMSNRGIMVTIITGLCFGFMSLFTQYGGPAEDGTDFIGVIFSILISAFLRLNIGPESTNTGVIDESVRLIGSDALTLIHVAGSASLLFLCILGVLYWLSIKESQPYYPLATGATIAILFAVVLSGPLLGVSALLPWRWFGFIYILLLLVAIPGLFSVISTHLSASTRDTIVLSILLLGALILPYFFVMSSGAISAYDGSPFNGAHGAERYSLTPQEKDAIEFITVYSNGTTQRLADGWTRSVLQRYYKTEASIITVNQDGSMKYNSPALLLNREYISTHHARYGIEGEGEPTRVHGRVPLESIPATEKNTVYDAGDDQVTYLHMNGS